jgi:hypothetical protein
MRITMSDAYDVHDCRFRDECEKMYCKKHRLLYRECESAVAGYEGDYDVVGGTRHVLEDGGDCPECLHQAKLRAFDRTRAEHGLPRVDHTTWQEIA